MPSDDADVYGWNGRHFRRVWDASAHGLRRGANIDVLDYSAGTWSVAVDGTAAGLTSPASTSTPSTFPDSRSAPRLAA